MTCLTTLITTTANNCIAVLTIGTITSLSTDVDVFLRNTATGRTDRFTATSSGAGLVTVDLSDFELLPNSSYVITIQIGGEYQEITIGTKTSTTVIMPVTIVNGMTIGDVILVGI